MEARGKLRTLRGSLRLTEVLHQITQFDQRDRADAQDREHDRRLRVLGSTSATTSAASTASRGSSTCSPARPHAAAPEPRNSTSPNMSAKLVEGASGSLVRRSSTACPVYCNNSWP